MKLIPRLYGSSPAHLVASVVGLVIAAFGIVRIFAFTNPWSVVLWLVAAIVLHDVVLLPVYTLVRRMLVGLLGVERDRRRRVPILAHLVVPTVVSGLLLLVWFPLVFGLGADVFTSVSKTSNDPYASRWLLITAGVYLFSALVYAVRAVRARGLPELAAAPADESSPTP